MRKLVLASANPGKLREIRLILAPLGVEIITQQEIGVVKAEEPHATFRENAIAKARHANGASGLPALADDSGICVDALGGAPGVRSARYAGDPTSDERNNLKLLEQMRHFSDRKARYVCVIALVRAADDPEPLVAEGEWRGEIAREPRGKGGFGYDPIFFIPARGQTAAEIDPMEKNRISHRALALANLLSRLQAEWK